MFPEFSKKLRVTHTPIPGVLVVDLPVHGDNRGWFKENWQREKMQAAGLPDFAPVQNNISYNEHAGTTRGIHAEPWNKFISVATGRIFGAWVDLREGPSFGAVFTSEIDASRAIFIPRGVGNAFQTLEDDTVYCYLVDDHWTASAQSEYTFLNLADETVNIPWPMSLYHAQLSEKDRDHPRLGDVVAMPKQRILVLGADGQLGKALRKEYADFPYVEFVSRNEFDLTDPNAYSARNWQNYSAVINAAAYTAVDKAETESGRQAAWAINVTAVAQLAKIATTYNLTLVHLSSDYIYDGLQEIHLESEPPTPLSVYGQTKAAGDAIVATVPKHYIVRTSWVIGEGNNFVRTMVELAKNGARPSVVSDQVGRLSFTKDIAAGIRHLLDANVQHGTYNLTNSGEAMSWADIAREVYELIGCDSDAVRRVTTEEYSKGRAMAPRPRSSVLELNKIESTGFKTEGASGRLRDYVKNEEW